MKWVETKTMDAPDCPKDNLVRYLELDLDSDANRTPIRPIQ